MGWNTILLATPALLLGLAICAGSAYAYTEREVIHLNELCHAGDRAACIHRDEAIHEHAHEAEWRRTHPEWYR